MTVSPPVAPGAAPSAAPPDGLAADADRLAVEAVRNGDAEAFRVLVRNHQPRVFALAWMMTRERGGAEEVTQDAFLNAYRHIDRYDMRRPFYPWLAAIATRLAQTWLRRHVRLRLHLEPCMDHTAAPCVPASTNHPLQALIADEQGRRLWAEVEALTSGERTVVLLYYRQQQGVSDIATQLAVTEGTVKTLLFRARRKLRDRLAREPDLTLREDTP